MHLLKVSKSFAGPGHLPNVVLRPTSVSVPTDRRVALLGSRRTGKTTLLQLLARTLRPDRGDILGGGGFSPVVNGGGFLNPQLTVLENIRFLGRAFGIAPDRLLYAVDAFCGIPFPPDGLVRAQDALSRKALEAAVTIVLPFSCYLVDEIGQLPPEVAERCIEAAGQRKAGLIFSTSQPRLVRQWAEWVLVIDDATLHAFTKAADAVQFFERRQNHEQY